MKLFCQFFQHLVIRHVDLYILFLKKHSKHTPSSQQADAHQDLIQARLRPPIVLASVDELNLFLLPHQIRVSLVHPPPRGERLRFLRSKSRIQRGIFQRQNRTRRRVIQGRLRPFVVRLPTTTVVAMMVTMRKLWS